MSGKRDRGWLSTACLLALIAVMSVAALIARGPTIAGKLGKIAAAF